MSCKFWFWMWAAQAVLQIAWGVVEVLHGFWVLIPLSVFCTALSVLMMYRNSRAYHVHGERP